MTGSFPAAMLLKSLPEISLVILAGLVLLLSLVWKKRPPQALTWITIAGLMLCLLLALLFALPVKGPYLIWGGLLKIDVLSFLFRMIFLTGAALTVLISVERQPSQGQGEYLALLITSVFGMCLMAASADILMLYLAIEITALPLFILAAFQFRQKKSAEAGLKYFLYGAMTSTVMVFGFSLLFGISGQTGYSAIAAALEPDRLPVSLTAGIFMLVLVGFLFKVSAAPFHFWAPDVYEGAPTPIAGFLSTASKAAGFAALMRILQEVFRASPELRFGLLAAAAVASMLIGNFLALRQKNLKRLLAYSSIAQAGYILVGAAVGTPLGASGAIYYLIAYLVTNLAAFGAVAVVSSNTGSDQIAAFSGLNRRNAALALVLGAALLSLGGVPVFAGFFGKFLVFASAVQAGAVWLTVIGVLNAVVGLYYYLNLLKVMYLDPVPEGSGPLTVVFPWKAALLVCAAGILVLGFIYRPWYHWADLAAQMLLLH